jgi:hypothetical protein
VLQTTFTTPHGVVCVTDADGLAELGAGPDAGADPASRGLLLRNYGRGVPIATLLAHIAYGAIVGAFASIAG